MNFYILVGITCLVQNDHDIPDNHCRNTHKSQEMIISSIDLMGALCLSG